MMHSPCVVNKEEKSCLSRECFDVYGSQMLASTAESEGSQSYKTVGKRTKLCGGFYPLDTCHDIMVHSTCVANKEEKSCRTRECLDMYGPQMLASTVESDGNISY